jgi:DNA-directed RNA polymerase specialized sigma24 family protein
MGVEADQMTEEPDDDYFVPQAASRIVNDLLADLPEDRRQAVRQAIIEAMSEWSDIVSTGLLGDMRG